MCFFLKDKAYVTILNVGVDDNQFELETMEECVPVLNHRKQMHEL